MVMMSCLLIFGFMDFGFGALRIRRAEWAHGRRSAAQIYLKLSHQH
jgi:hypothetical protein